MIDPKLEKEIAQLSDQEYNRLSFRNDIQEHEVSIIAQMKQPDVHSEQEIAEMRGRYDSVEKKLLEYGIEFKINSFHAFEIATFQINKIEQDEQHH